MKTHFLFALAALFFMSSAQSEEKTLLSGKIEFFATGDPSFLKIHGKAESLNGSIQETKNAKETRISGTFEITNESFTTGLSLRDRHLKEKVFEVSKFGKTQFVLDGLEMGLAPGTGPQKFSGKMLLHGKEKLVQGSVELRQNESPVQFLAKFEIKLTDFDIQPPEFSGIKVNDSVRIEVSGGF